MQTNPSPAAIEAAEKICGGFHMTTAYGSAAARCIQEIIVTPLEKRIAELEYKIKYFKDANTIF
jgi:hypothetical protein